MKEKKYKLLILEDDIESNRFYEILFEKKYDIDVFDNVDDAESEVQRNFYHLFIVDISLKGKKSGLDFIRILRQDNKFAEVPIICLTSYVSITDRRAAIEAGCTLFLEKPVFKEILLSSVNSLIDNE